MNEPSIFEEKEGTMEKNCMHIIKNEKVEYNIEHKYVHNIYGHNMIRSTY